MVALLGGEDISLPLHCGIAECSHDASDSPTRRALSSCSAEGFLFSFSDHFQLHPHCYNPQLGQLLSLSLVPWPCASACCPLPALIHAINNWAHLSRPPPRGQTPQPAHHCVLPLANARTRCRLMASSRNPATFSLSSYRLKECVYILHKHESKTLLLKTAFIFTSFMKA